MYVKTALETLLNGHLEDISVLIPHNDRGGSYAVLQQTIIFIIG